MSATVLWTALGLLAAQDAGAPFAETRVEVVGDATRLALRDLDGDGALELLQIDRGSVSARRLAPDGTYEERAAVVHWPESGAAWELADLDGDGRVELLAILDGRRLVRYRYAAPGDGAAPTWADPEPLLEEPCYLPSGVSRVAFVQDVDADGRFDVVLPGAGRFHVRRNLGPDPEAPGGIAWDAPLEVGFEPDVRVDLGDPDRLSSTFSQSVRVPLFTVRDVDGDGRQDLVSETEDRVAFHLARPEIDALPTWELDLAALGEARGDTEIDLDDLLSIVAGMAQWRIADLDGKAPHDLVVGVGGTFRLYLGGSVTGPRDRADQVLKASGNILQFFLRDVLGDDRPDLQIARGERISLARLLRFLVVPGRIDFELFTYENEDGSFSRRPTRRTTLALRVPRLLTFLDEADEISEELERQWDVPARRIAWDVDGEADDVVDARDDELLVFRDRAPPPQRWEDLPLDGIDSLIERVLLEDLDRLEDGGENVIDLGALDQFAVAPGAAFREATRGGRPVARHPLWSPAKDRQIRARDLDGDGRNDLIVVGEAKGDRWYVQLLVRR